MSLVEQDTTWFYVQEGMCVLDNERTTWWVMGRRWNEAAQVWQFLLEHGGRRAVIDKPLGPEGFGGPVTIAVFNYDDRIAFMAEVFQATGRWVEPNIAPEVITSPNTQGRRVGS